MREQMIRWLLCVHAYVSPETLSEAYASPDAEYWKEPVLNEMDSILINGT
jgi:hypothetical protein